MTNLGTVTEYWWFQKANFNVSLNEDQWPQVQQMARMRWSNGMIFQRTGNFFLRKGDLVAWKLQHYNGFRFII